MCHNPDLAEKRPSLTGGYHWVKIFSLPPEKEIEFPLPYRSWVHVILFQKIVYRIHTKCWFFAPKTHFVSKVYTIHQLLETV